jgi:hypothetical protein
MGKVMTTATRGSRAAFADATHKDMADFGMNVDTTGREKAQTHDPAKDGRKTSGTMPSPLGHREGY